MGLQPHLGCLGLAALLHVAAGRSTHVAVRLRHQVRPALAGLRLAGQRRVVHLEVVGVDDADVGGHLVALLQCGGRVGKGWESDAVRGWWRVGCRAKPRGLSPTAPVRGLLPCVAVACYTVQGRPVLLGHISHGLTRQQVSLAEP